MDLEIGVAAPEFLEKFRRLRRQRNLLEYDGPLLCEFTSDEGEHFLVAWCDVDTVTNRWLVHAVPAEKISSYLANEVTLRQLILESGPVAYVVDINTYAKPVQARCLEISQIPSDYLPTDESWFSR